MATNEILAQKAARRKLNLLELASELDNVSKACKIMGYSRQQFYEIRRNFQTYGSQGLLDRMPGTKDAHPNRLSEELEAAILEYSLRQPTHGPVRVAQNLVLQGHKVSSGGVRGVWSRHNLQNRHQRLLRLEQEHQQNLVQLTMLSPKGWTTSGIE
jgi:molybdenum-dependent DNA-binding transcriptional regulator ModE